MNENFLSGAMAKFSKLLRSGGYCVMASNDEGAAADASKYFTVEDVVEIRVHRSLTRYVYVLRSPISGET